jgi:predicted O-methyltransferase YrrM
MKKQLVIRVILFVVLVASLGIRGSVWAADMAKKTVFRIPQISGIEIDGSSEDWGDRGFFVNFITAPDGRILPADDFDVKFRLGWDKQGLLVLAEVHDDIPVEHENPSRLWQRDCVELFLSESVGSTQRHQVVIASGADPNTKKTRHKIYDWRLPDQKVGELTAQTASRVSSNGYVVEAMLPWSNVGVQPRLGEEAGFQFVANDDDGAGDSSGPLRVAWYPAMGPGSPLNMYSLRLSEKPSESIVFQIRRVVNEERYAISIQGTKKLIGVPVTLKSANKTIAQRKMEGKEGRAELILKLNPETYPDFWPQIDVQLGEQIVRRYEESPTLKKILGRYIDAVGGRDAVIKLSTRVCEGEFVDDLSWQEPKIKRYDLRAYAEVPNKWITILELPEGTEQNGYDGATGWKLNTDRIERNGRAQRSWLSFLLNPQGILHIHEYFPDLRLEGKVIIGKREVYLVETSSSDETQNRLYFDAETGLLVRVGKHWELGDYREVDGIKFPFRIAQSRKGGESYFSFEKITHNVSIDSARFSKPAHENIFAKAFEGLEDSKVLPLLKCKGLTYTHEDMNVPVKDGRFLHDFIVERGYRRGLEIGTFTGYSTLWMGLGFRKTDGELITIEIDSSYGKVAQENFRKAGLDDVIDSRINDALEEIPQVEGTFDFVFIDAWKPDYLKYLDLLRDRMRPGGAIIAHNVTNYARDMQEFLDAIKNDPGLETTFNEISAEGMSISLVKFPEEEKKWQKLFAIEELQADFQQMQELMKKGHNILYKFTDKAAFDLFVDTQYAKIDRPMSLAEFYRIISPVLAKIGCGHSSIWLPKDYWKNTSVKLMPLRVVFLDGKAYVWRFYRTVEDIPEGVEIISINGKPISEILEALKNNISADGYMDSRKLYKINQAPSFFYALQFGFPDKFRFVFRYSAQSEPQVFECDPVDLKTIENAQAEINTTEFNPLDFTLDLEILEPNSPAVLTIRSFVYYENPEKFNDFIDEVFVKIKKLKIKNLLLDLRNNGGGNPFCTSHLFSYLIPESLPYFAEEYRRYDQLAKPIPRAENAFQGRLITLINGGCFSSTPHLCALFKYHKIGTFVGTEAGATYTCNGATREIKLSHTGFIAVVSRRSYAAAVDGFPEDRGILPDYEVMPRIDDLIQGKDAQKDYALKLISQSPPQ